ncbi:type I restriction endonuclease subunit R [Amphritea japonica]|uniref:Type I restriction enzyme endonuclease subunit n=1 Tax=Amphritea japonica ATCC BAA-1530 TaxID=1278309 RepID=A0A7R6ST07_9GAMM|nr:HsdR family type I site-specific deoxyribonuclease [Amphritea japonica]BBB26815.1 type I restriction enzyme, R subunit [Amphritea japonica ATCC BAA-1530]
MSAVGQRERATQNRVVKLFQNQLDYQYYGDWQKRVDNSNIEESYLRDWLGKQGVESGLITDALRQLKRAAAMGDGKKLYHANNSVYGLLRYGVKVRQTQGGQTQTVWLIDWQQPQNNEFAIAEEVSIKGEHTKRPDIVLYVNGIALGVIELKRSSVSVTEGIRQNLDNQKKTFIRDFFSTMQLVMAGNDTEGLRYGTIETSEKHYYRWKEENPAYNPELDDRSKKHFSLDDVDYADELLDFDIIHLCQKKRFLELIHDFIVFDAGVKKTSRHNQYSGVKAAQQRVQENQGGIIWHTQGSGKSLSMVWLAKWIREHVANARVLVVTDRTELDDQIEGVYQGVDEEIYRCTSGADLIATLNASDQWLLCSLVHKFGRRGGADEDDTQAEKATDEYIQQLKESLPDDFSAKGNLFVFVDECHRTQSGKLHDAMQVILPDSVFIGFTGTPLLKKDKQKSIEVFGSYIHTYKFDEAVADGVVLDLQYEARDIDQYIKSPEKIDEWFELNTKGLTDMAKVQLKQRWGTMKKVLSSKDRLEMIVNDILMDMMKRPRLMDGRGNAMLVCASIYQACKVYELFNGTDLKGKCAIVTSYLPSPNDIKGEESGEGYTEKLHQYQIYQDMLADYFEVSKDEAIKKAEEFEQRVKEQFKKEPGQMRLLIVVDKLLTGFDAPSATYLYIDKKMQDHGLFQAICRVNRLDGEDKEYGYIVDYKDLFHSLETSIGDYTSGAFDAYEQEDVQGLLTDRLVKSREKLEQALETSSALCEPVLQPKATIDYLRYFCGDVLNPEALKLNEAKRVSLYRNVAALVRAYANMASEMEGAGYSATETRQIKTEVEHFADMRKEVKIASRDEVDLKQFEPAMRRLLDTYIKAEDSELLIDFEELGLVELIITKIKQCPPKADNKPVPEAMAETIENNIRKVIIDEQPINPKYYEKMSELLDALIEQRRDEAISYEAYLKEVKKLAEGVVKPDGLVTYPQSMNSKAKQSLYDNLNGNETLVSGLDEAVKSVKKEGWKSNRFKYKSVENAVTEQLASYNVDLSGVMDIIKNQTEYD